MSERSHHQKESDRLASVRRVQRLMHEDLAELQQIAQLAALTLRAPTALVSLVDHDQQVFLARVGFDEAQTEIATSICAHAILQEGVFEVCDLGAGARFVKARLVQSTPHFRYYAGAPLVTEDGYALGTLCVLDTEPRQLSADAQQQLSRLADFVVNIIALRKSIDRRDPVTGLPNRKKFKEELLAMAEEEQPQPYWACLVNVFDAAQASTLRQARGVEPMESLLKQAAQRLTQALHSVAHIYHVGVTQFAFVLHMPNESAAKPLLGRVAKALSVPLVEQGTLLHPICRGGVVPFMPGKETDVFRRMITAMHQAIAEEDEWVLYDAHRDAEQARRYRLASGVMQAIARQQFYVVYQPRLSLITGKMVAVEALLRWKHPELGEVSPAEFIPVISATPYMVALTDWVIQAVAVQIKLWRAKGIELPVAINLAMGDFADGRLPDRIMRVCDQQGVPLSSLELEVTEGEWLHPESLAASQLSLLRDMGAKIAIDDFGSGFSNFNYLTRLPIDTVKIDRSLVSGFLFDHTKQAILQAIIRMAQSIGVLCVAEGVEGAGEREILSLMGCRQAQGFYFSHPVSAAEITLDRHWMLTSTV